METYTYIFNDGMEMTFLHELPFSLLKFAIDKHGALVKCYKKVVGKREN